MTNRYVRSADGNNADTGATWALAKATLAGGAAIDVAGDTIVLSQAHSESGTSVVPTFAGTLSLPTYVVCMNDGAEPPTAVATGALVVSTTGSINLVNGGGSSWHYGITYRVGSGSSSDLSLNANGGAGCAIGFDTCTLELATTGSGSLFDLGGADRAFNCTFKFAAAGQNVRLGANTIIRGGGVASGGTSPTTVFKSNTTGHFLVEGFDFSQCSSTVNLYTPNSGFGIISGRFVNCKLPASWSGSLVATVADMQSRDVIEMINCAGGSTNYAYWRQMLCGAVIHETTVVRTGGASDGVTTLSWKMTSNANANYPMLGLESEDLLAYVDTTGSPITATIEIVTDNVTLKDNEAWLELMYLGSSGTPLGSFVSDVKADFAATAANQDSSSVTWTTTGLTTPVKQKLVVTFTPQMVGFIVGRVVLAKASTTMYVDPKLILT